VFEEMTAETADKVSNKNVCDRVTHECCDEQSAGCIQALDKSMEAHLNVSVYGS